MLTSAVAPYIQPLAWDSEFFGLPIARTQTPFLKAQEMEQVVRACEQARVQCLYCELDPEDAAALEQAQKLGFRFVELRMVLHHDLRQPADAAPASPAGAALAVDVQPQPEDMPALEEIALAIAPQSRFAVDLRFGAEASRRLYLRWLHNSLRDSAVTFLLMRQAGQVAGFATLKPAGSDRRLELIGVAPTARGQGIGAQLLRAVVSSAAAAGAAQVTVVTQGRNTSAVRMYERAGFRLAHVTYYFHKWFEQPQA